MENQRVFFPIEDWIKICAALHKELDNPKLPIIASQVPDLLQEIADRRNNEGG